MKKRFTVLFVFMAVLMLTACGGNYSPKQVVNTFCRSAKAFNVVKMSECVGRDFEDYGELQDLLGAESEYISIFTLFKKMSSKLSYDIVKTESDGDVATVTVNFKYCDASEVVKASFDQYIQNMLANYFAGEEMDINDFYDILLEKFDIKTIPMTEGTGTFECVRTKDGWVISEMSTGVYNAILGNFIYAFTENY